MGRSTISIRFVTPPVTDCNACSSLGNSVSQDMKHLDDDRWKAVHCGFVNLYVGDSRKPVPPINIPQGLACPPCHCGLVVRPPVLPIMANVNNSSL